MISNIHFIHCFMPFWSMIFSLFLQWNSNNSLFSILVFSLFLSYLNQLKVNFLKQSILQNESHQLDQFSSQQYVIRNSFTSSPYLKILAILILVLIPNYFSWLQEKQKNKNCECETLLSTGLETLDRICLFHLHINMFHKVSKVYFHQD